MRHVNVLINNSGVGGAERRLGRLFARRADRDPRAILVVNRALWRRLREAGAVTGRERRVWRLPEPCLALSGALGCRSGRVGFWLRKMDYVIFAFLLSARYVLAPAVLFHAALGGTYVLCPLLVLRPGHRVVVSVTNPSLEQMLGSAVGLPLYRYALARCARIDALTANVRASLIKTGFDAAKIAVPPGSVVDAEHFQPAATKEPWVVFAGRLVEDKNPTLFVEALPAVRRAVPDARFFLFGEGPLSMAVADLVARLDLHSVVELGFRADLAPVLSRAVVFVSLQRQDNYPSQSLLEAMSAGMAVVATDVGLTWQLVGEETGLRVKPEPSEVAQAVITLLRDPGRCRTLGAGARRRVRRQHSEGQYERYLEAEYAALSAASPPHPDPLTPHPVQRNAERVPGERGGRGGLPNP